MIMVSNRLSRGDRQGRFIMSLLQACCLLCLLRHPANVKGLSRVSIKSGESDAFNEASAIEKGCVSH